MKTVRGNVYCPKCGSEDVATTVTSLADICRISMDDLPDMARDVVGNLSVVRQYVSVQCAHCHYRIGFTAPGEYRP